jgi:hypothetical protein
VEISNNDVITGIQTEESGLRCEYYLSFLDELDDCATAWKGGETVGRGLDVVVKNGFRNGSTNGVHVNDENFGVLIGR